MADVSAAANQGNAVSDQVVQRQLGPCAGACQQNDDASGTQYVAQLVEADLAAGVHGQTWAGPEQLTAARSVIFRGREDMARDKGCQTPPIRVGLDHCDWIKAPLESNLRCK
jgi:hypothetical protein